MLHVLVGHTNQQQQHHLSLLLHCLLLQRLYLVLQIHPLLFQWCHNLFFQLRNNKWPINNMNLQWMMMTTHKNNTTWENNKNSNAGFGKRSCRLWHVAQSEIIAYHTYFLNVIYTHTKPIHFITQKHTRRERIYTCTAYYTCVLARLAWYKHCHSVFTILSLLVVSSFIIFCIIIHTHNYPFHCNYKSSMSHDKRDHDERCMIMITNKRVFLFFQNELEWEWKKIGLSLTYSSKKKIKMYVSYDQDTSTADWV